MFISTKKVLNCRAILYSNTVLLHVIHQVAPHHVHLVCLLICPNPNTLKNFQDQSQFLFHNPPGHHQLETDHHVQVHPLPHLGPHAPQPIIITIITTEQLYSINISMATTSKAALRYFSFSTLSKTNQLLSTLSTS